MGPFIPDGQEADRVQKTRSWSVLIMAGGHIVFAGLVTLTHYGVNAIQTPIMIVRLRNRARLKFHLCALRQFDRFQGPEHAAFIYRTDCLHTLPPSCYTVAINPKEKSILG